MSSRQRGFTTLVVVVLLLVGGIAGVGITPAVAEEHTNATCEYPLVVEDATGTEVELTEPADEIVALDAASAQILWELGAADQVTGLPVAPYTEYLEGSQEKQNVLTAEGAVNQEAVIELDPDLVVAGNVIDETAVEQLREAGLTVYQSPLDESVDAVTEKTTQFGALIDACDAADRSVANVEADFEAIETATADEEEPLVLYYFFDFTAGQGTFINEIMTAAGATTVAEEENITGFQPISDEVIAEADPEWIVVPSGFELPEDEEPFASTTAVESDQVLTVDEDLISQAGPRVVVPLRSAAEAFHPDVDFGPLNRIDPAVTLSVPDTVDSGEELSVEVGVEQTGQFEGVDTVTVSLDGETIHTEEVTLEPGETTDIEIPATAPEVDSTTEVTVEVTAGYLSEQTTVTVEAETEEPTDEPADEETPEDDEPTEPTPDPVPGFGIPAAVAGMIAAGVWLLRRGH